MRRDDSEEDSETRAARVGENERGDTEGERRETSGVVDTADSQPDVI